MKNRWHRIRSFDGKYYGKINIISKIINYISTNGIKDKRLEILHRYFNFLDAFDQALDKLIHKASNPSIFALANYLYVQYETKRKIKDKEEKRKKHKEEKE